MGLAWVHLCSIFECCTAIGCPGYLKDPSGLPHALDPQPWPESTVGAQVLHHLTHGDLEMRLLVGRQATPIAQEWNGTKERGHRTALILIESSQKRLWRIIESTIMSGNCRVSFALLCLPLRRPEPCLVWVHLLLLNMLTYRLNPRAKKRFGLLAAFMRGFFDYFVLLIRNLENMTHDSALWFFVPPLLLYTLL
jgi:hypothetical protein